MNLPENIRTPLTRLFAAIPLASSMPHLQGSHPHHIELLQQILEDPVLANRPDPAAGLWLYVDDLDRCHALCQDLPDPTGAFWHGIMHRREGDFSNSHYWMRRAARHPVLQEHPELDPHGLVDAVSRACDRDDQNLVLKQREEWAALFEWCVWNA